MKRFTFVVVLLSATALAAGCSGGYDDAAGDLAAKRAADEASRPASPPPEEKPAGDQAAAPSDEEPPQAQAAPSPRTEPRSPRPKPSASEPAVTLSAGVALPQTGPTGTLMSFSVDYRFTQGPPDRSSPYVWVIQRAKGEPARQEVRLAGRGTLQILIPGWRPEEGPFQTHLEDNAARKLSDSAPLR